MATTSDELWRFPGQHEYDGIVYCSAMKPGALDRIKKLQLHPEDILISNYPKAGTVWVGEIVWLIMNEADTELAKKSHNRQRLPMVELCWGDNWNVDKIEEQTPGSRLLTTHLMPEFFQNLTEQKSMPKVIMVMRNPKDTLVSFYHFYRANAALGNFSGTFHDFFKLFEAKKLNYGDFFDYTEAWVNHPLKNEFFFVTYENMKMNLESEIRRMCKFLGKKLNDKQIQKIVDYSSFDQMKNNPMAQLGSKMLVDASISPYVRKGIVGDWKSHMIVDESDLVDRLCRERLDPIGISFMYQ